MMSTNSSDGRVATIPIICGPTGSGKTATALKLAASFPIEIISADSRQIYRKLDIGTAKPTTEEQNLVPIHLIDIIDPGERYSAYRFIEDCQELIPKILSRKRHPVIVGGTGLYLYALTEGVVEIEEEDMSIREKLEYDADQNGLEMLHRTLKEIDPLEAEKTHPNNRNRIIRALEVYYLTGKTKTELITEGKHTESSFTCAYFCLTPDREALYAKINARTDQMLTDGWIGEVRDLLDTGHRDALIRSNVIGYNDIIRYLDNELTLEEVSASIKQTTRRYAKRQMTWFRNKIEASHHDLEGTLLESVTSLLANP